VIMRAKDMENDPAKPITTSIGSGPFRFNKEARVSGALTVFDRNPDYVPRADRRTAWRTASREGGPWEWRVVPDAATGRGAAERRGGHLGTAGAGPGLLLSQKPAIRISA
jgi:peptide/nickel transport system substrate-binding protein